MEKLDYNIKITEDENQIHRITGLVSTNVFKEQVTETENKTPKSKKKRDYNAKISEIENKVLHHDQYVTTPGCNKLSEKIFNIKIIKQI